MSDEANKLVDTFASAPLASHPGRWDALYAESYHPWDRAGPSVALDDLLHQRRDLIPASQELDARNRPVRDAAGKAVRRTALVPGCGYGHDVLLLAARGYDVWGLDGSGKALEGAKSNEEEVKASGYRGYEMEAGVERGDVHWVEADFFAEGWEKGLGLDGSGTFELIFDYTFLCALPPSARPLWARRMTSLLSHEPTSRLICLEFPTGKSMKLGGPPWGVWPETYEALLGGPGEEVSYREDGTPKHTLMKPSADGLHRLCLIKPGRTHAAGTNEDGSVKDFISVWSR